MVAISKQRDQRRVTRHYYAGEFLPGLKDFVADIRAQVDKVKGFDLVDAVAAPTEDEFGVVRMTYIALFERDGTTLEAQAAKVEEDALGWEPSNV